MINVSNASELAAALSSASPGDTISLADGNYGDLSILPWQNVAKDLTIQAATPRGARFSKVRVSSNEIVLYRLKVTGRFTISDADSVTVRDCLFTSWTEVLNASNVGFVGNEGTATLNLDDVAGFLIQDNYIHHVDGNDLIRVIGDSYGGQILNNTLYDAQPYKFPDGTYTHIDAIQMFSRPDGTPRDIVIRGNYIYDDPATSAESVWLQGIFLGGPTGGYRRITIEENLVDTDTPNAIFVVRGVESVTIRNNTVLGSGSIKADGEDNAGLFIEKNVARTITAEGGAQVGDNYRYETRDIFQADGDGATWAGFLPKPGTAIDFGSGYGALQRLTELLGDARAGSDPEPAPEPKPAPEPAPEPPVSLPESFIDQPLIVGGDTRNAAVVPHNPAYERERGAWVLRFKAESFGGKQFLLSKDARGYGKGGHLGVYLGSQGGLHARVQSEAELDIISADPGKVALGFEHTLVLNFSFDGVFMYLDGELIKVSDHDGGMVGNTEPVLIGANQWSSDPGVANNLTDPFTGEISLAVLYGEPLTEAEIADLSPSAGEPDEPDETPEPVVDIAAALKAAKKKARRLTRDLEAIEAAHEEQN